MSAARREKALYRKTCSRFALVAGGTPAVPVKRLSHDCNELDSEPGIAGTALERVVISTNLKTS
jgi:hypothetical protein